MDSRELGRLRSRFHARRNRGTAVRGVEEREVVGAESHHRHAERLEDLERRRHVEQRLDPRRDDDGACSGELAEVGGDVRWVRKAAMHATETAGSHDANPDGAADRERPADRGRTDRTLRHARGEIPRACLARRRVEAFELVTGQPDADLPVEDADRRRDRTRCRSDASPTATPSPAGKPCAISVVSSATTALASRTSSATTITAAHRAERRTVPRPRRRARARRRGTRPPARPRPRLRRPPHPGGRATRAAPRRGRALRATPA